VAGWYREELGGVRGLRWQAERDWARHAWWQFVAVAEDDFGCERDTVLELLRRSGIDARRIYYPLHTLPIYKDSARGEFPVAEDLANRGICLPTWSGLTRDDVHFVCEQLKSCSRA